MNLSSILFQTVWGWKASWNYKEFCSVNWQTMKRNARGEGSGKLFQKKKKKKWDQSFNLHSTTDVTLKSQGSFAIFFYSGLGLCWLQWPKQPLRQQTASPGLRVAPFNSLTSAKAPGLTQPRVGEAQPCSWPCRPGPTTRTEMPPHSTPPPQYK